MTAEWCAACGVYVAPTLTRDAHNATAAHRANALEHIEAVMHPSGRCTECGGGQFYWKHLEAERGGDPLLYHVFQAPKP